MFKLHAFPIQPGLFAFRELAHGNGNEDQDGTASLRSAESLIMNGSL